MNNLSRLVSLRELVLGSGSPRRKQLLEEKGLSFKIILPEITELRLDNEPPIDYALRLAQAKALQVAEQCDDRAVVLGGDTIVILGGKVLEKPADEADAMKMLREMSGQVHTVCTAQALANRSGLLASGSELSKVRFNEVSDEQLREYIASGEPMDKAGAYGIQAKGAFLVDSVEGRIDNVIGLPFTLLDRIAGEALLQLQPIRDVE